MNIRKGLSTFAVVGVLAASVAYGDQMSEMYSALPLPYGDLLSRADSGFAANYAEPGIGEMWMATPDILQGEVTALDENGTLMLRTEQGTFALRFFPEDIQGVSIGDVISVSSNEVIAVVPADVIHVTVLDFSD